MKQKVSPGPLLQHHRRTCSGPPCREEPTKTLTGMSQIQKEIWSKMLQKLGWGQVIASQTAFMAQNPYITKLGWLWSFLHPNQMETVKKHDPTSWQNCSSWFCWEKEENIPNNPSMGSPWLSNQSVLLAGPVFWWRRWNSAQKAHSSTNGAINQLAEKLNPFLVAGGNMSHNTGEGWWGGSHPESAGSE